MKKQDEEESENQRMTLAFPNYINLLKINP